MYQPIRMMNALGVARDLGADDAGRVGVVLGAVLGTLSFSGQNQGHAAFTAPHGVREGVNTVTLHAGGELDVSMALCGKSRIQDVDVAAETANMTRANILTQAGVSILAQANQAPQAARVALPANMLSSSPTASTTLRLRPCAEAFNNSELPCRRCFRFDIASSFLADTPRPMRGSSLALNWVKRNLLGPMIQTAA